MATDNSALDEIKDGPTDQPADSSDQPDQPSDQDQSEQADEAAKLKEAVQVETADAGTLRKKLTITIPREYLDERLTSQFDELRRESIVPGFRKGRAPIELIQKRFGDDVDEQLIGQLIGSSFMAAVEKTELKPLGDPLIWVEMPETTSEGRKTGEKALQLVPVDTAIEHMSLPAQDSLTYTCEVEIKPEFELPDLDGIPVEKPTLEIGPDDIDRELDRLRANRGQYVPVEDAVKPDDLIIAGVTQTIAGENVKVEENVTLAARPQVVDGIPLEDLGKSLAGKKSGDTVTIDATVPDDHARMEWRGKKTQFAIKILDVKRLRLPEMDDQFVQSLGFDSLDELKEQIQHSLESELSSVIQRGMRGQIAKHLLEHTQLDVPPGLSARQTQRLVAKKMVELYQNGVPEQEVNKQIDELQLTASKEAAEELKMFFIMEKIADQMEVEIGDDELNGAIAQIAAQRGRRFDRVRDELVKGEGLTALYLGLRDDKILDLLLTRAGIKEIDPKKLSQAESGTSGKTGKTTKKSESKQAKKDSKSGEAKKSAPKGKDAPAKPKKKVAKSDDKAKSDKPSGKAKKAPSAKKKRSSKS